MHPLRLLLAAAPAASIVAVVIPKVASVYAFVSPSPSRHLTAASRPPLPRISTSSAPTDDQEHEAVRQSQSVRGRFARTAPNATSLDDPCVLTIRGVDYNVTAWAKSHPGGEAALKRHRHHNTRHDAANASLQPDATAAFEATGHSDEARKLLETFRIEESSDGTSKGRTSTGVPPPPAQSLEVGRARGEGSAKRWRNKLFTHEDPRAVHKTLGTYALLHFTLRIYQMIQGRDPAAGMGSNLGRGSSLSGLLCLVPHLALSLSSLIFDTVPRERVVGKPMIWKENRIHSIAFGTRSVLCAALAWVSVRADHSPAWRALAVWGSAASVLATMVLADAATARLGPSETDSSVATLPFWEGCSHETQQRVKRFYAFTQFVATSTCLAVANPAWPLLMLFPIQLASFLLTLSRKGLISGAGWHLGYTASLVLPFFVAVRTSLYLGSATFVTGLLGTSFLLFHLRCLGVNKYALWAPVIAARVAFGDRFVPYQMW